MYSWHLPDPLQQMNKNEKQLILTQPVQFPGTYSCTAFNSQGTTTKYFTVIEAPSKRLLSLPFSLSFTSLLSHSEDMIL